MSTTIHVSPIVEFCVRKTLYFRHDLKEELRNFMWKWFFGRGFFFPLVLTEIN